MVMILVALMQLLQVLLCYKWGLYFESFSCLVCFIVQIILLLLVFKFPKATYHLTCLNCIIVIISGNIHNELNINASTIFFSAPPVINIALVGLRWGALWTGFMILLSTSLMYASRFYSYGWGPRPEELSFNIQLSNYITVPLILFGMFGYFFYRKNKAEAELTDLNVKLFKEKSKKEKLITILFHDIGRNASLLSAYLDLSDEKPELRNKVKDISFEIKKILDDAKSLDTQFWTPNKTETFSNTELFYSLKSHFDALLQKKKISFIPSFESKYHLTGSKTQIIHHIFGNILSNAIKFAYPDTRIIFKAYTNGSNKVIEVINDGLELDTKLVKTGTANEQGSGNGLKIINEFIRMNDMKFEIFKKSSKTIARVIFAPNQ